MCRLFDSHAHYYSPDYGEDRDALLKDAFEHHLSGVIEIGTDLATSRAALDMAARYPQISCAAGVQPYYAAADDAADLGWLEEMAVARSIVAIGEIGLDYHYTVDREIQRTVFIRQLVLARKYGLPVIIHHRDAAGDMMRMIREGALDGLAGVFHCYSGNTDMTRMILDVGWYISYAGPVTFKNFKKQEVVKQVPLERMLVESDAPYLSPAPYRGTRYEPPYLQLTARKIAEIHGVSLADVAERTAYNTRTLFNIN